ncbi:Trehalose-6-phosphate phosphatase [Mycena sanguinolenta]|uniref:Trehalose-6-phosphate phosphatase n=1 Tax=Mycena sanguinolenta TaxID=230812 RepID=A0A8H6XPY9_9AGAR|nr:Trehalose-6-phosphate phosphatase [Mycena sanguinolenta]
MDSFAEPYTRLGDDISLDEVRAQVRALEADHRAAGIPLSGRVLHVCHYLPVIATLNPAPGVLSPPATPPRGAKDLAADGAVTPTRTAPSVPDIKVEGDSKEKENEDDSNAIWTLVPRYGHAAMISGIRSPCSHPRAAYHWLDRRHYQQLRVPTSQVSESQREALADALASYQPKEHDPDDDKKTEYVPVWLDDAVAHGHYDGYCKQTLWPLFHYLLWQDVAAEASSQESQYYSHYSQANEAFASAITAVYRPGDLIWVHDYHLLLVPKLLRVAIPEAVIGLFVHTPFPSSEVFRCLPRRKEILDGMVGADLVCFQTYSYSRHFTSTCIRVCGYETTPRGIDAEGHVTAVTHCPVGVDAERVGRDILRPGITPKLDALRALYEGKKIIVGRDKLDVVKGVLQKLQAFQKLLQSYPEWVGNVVLIQVTSPSLTDSPKLERQISELVANINGEFGSLDFVPVHHYHQTLKKDEFYALLSVADLAVITPLRDGMNTTSMEFVIAQVGFDSLFPSLSPAQCSFGIRCALLTLSSFLCRCGRTKKSPVVLSEFMGISKHMEHALMVNPWNLGDVAAAINEGLLMSEPEKLARHEALHKVVTTHTSHTWAAVLVKMLLGQLGGKETARRTPYIPREVLESRYHAAKKRLFFFDYDGTLAPIVKTPSMAVPSAATLTALERLSADPRNVVYIISGRDGEFLEQHLGHLKHVGFSAEHGGFMRAPGEETWVNLTEKLDMSWMGEVEEVFRYYTERTTGSVVEMKKSSITWHYRASDPEWGLFQCRQCQDLLENNLAHKRPIEVLVGKKNLEVRPIAVNKGEIVKRLLYKNPDAEFIFCAGDDKTDEDMFRALILFGTGATKATMEAPLSVTLLDEGSGKGSPNGSGAATPVELAIKPDCVFTTAVGHSSKRTLASWHVTTPQEIVEHMLGLVGETASAQSHL